MRKLLAKIKTLKALNRFTEHAMQDMFEAHERERADMVMQIGVLRCALDIALGKLPENLFNRRLTK